MIAQGVHEITVKAYRCVLCQTVHRTEEEAASCYRLCVTADQDPISKLFAYQRRQLLEGAPVVVNFPCRIIAGTMVYTIRDGRLYSDSLPAEGAELYRVIACEVGVRFEAIIRIRNGGLSHLWSGKPIDKIRPEKEPGIQIIRAHVPGHPFQ